MCACKSLVGLLLLVLAPTKALRLFSTSRLQSAVIDSNRRLFIQQASTAAIIAGLPQSATADETQLVPLYFGAGCFWHVQHELALHEALTLQRRGAQITAVSGYAGGTRLGDQNRVCYHNFKNIADYGRLGHAEVVQVSVPRSAVADFAAKYFSLFGQRGYRHDPQDRGGEYRSLIGLRDGINSDLYAEVSNAAQQSPMQLVRGVGDEEDTIAAKTVLVMDSSKFPFYPAEVYHQFHNDFQGPPYGATYNSLNGVLVKAGYISQTGCPENAF
mmetsp:Transcript_53036/g.88068  ORF Transcript_53036/g.88068 Transcript_53036/m.88068 type:complete len:272 (+) Transcript_53036:89-904(+)|eukprot:CAMPEP_0119309672 /NCGR_PEP_ID=MMETSP1333-20130426/15920_1 /TAXON_ID=418940 /ORGANISM="Scyphosphaera apsteinii, Strain RCC1455" /LENGTH=271 /DNA_ID=CAMNT_0007313677 /DNA_START=111 /DNA_END=926 /DNA_ORIENTATION=+